MLFNTNAQGFILAVAMLLVYYVNTNLYFLVRKLSGGPG